MTIKQFAEKYDVPYHLAYEATFGASANSPDDRTRNYSEKDMVKNLIGILKQNKSKAMQKVKKYDRQIEEVKRIEQSL